MEARFSYPMTFKIFYEVLKTLDPHKKIPYLDILSASCVADVPAIFPINISPILPDTHINMSTTAASFR